MKALQASVRSVITYALFLVFAVVKISALATLLQTDGITVAMALFAAVMFFWFSSCQISKMRQGG